MRKYFPVIIMFLAVSFLACQDSRDDVKIENPDIAFYKTVGEEIPWETGEQWREFYERENSKQGRLPLSNFCLSSSQVNALMQSVDELVGIAFHYGIDENGVTHIIAIPVDDSLRLWNDIPGRIYIDTRTGQEISASIAGNWAENFKQANPNDIWFHFFGVNIFDEIASISYFNSLTIMPALSLLNLQPQLLLIIWNDILPVGRTNQEQGKVYDASFPCPPCSIQ